MVIYHYLRSGEGSSAGPPVFFADSRRGSVNTLESAKKTGGPAKLPSSDLKWSYFTILDVAKATSPGHLFFLQIPEEGL
jgi:hypothetical protein